LPAVCVVHRRGAHRRGDTDEARSDLVVGVLLYLVLNAVLYGVWFTTGSPIVGLASGVMTVLGLVGVALFGRRRSRRCM